MQSTLFAAFFVSFMTTYVQSSPVQSPSGQTAVSGWTYSGCYTEATADRALNSKVYYDDLMTLEKCALACGSFSYFGVEYGRECYCGQSPNTGSVPATSESECSFSCPGNKLEVCGAGNRLNIYQKSSTASTSISTTTTSLTSTSLPTAPSSYAAKGCYVDTNRALTGKTYYDDAMTISKCADACTGFTYFGLEYYRECYCGNSLSSDVAPSTDCQYACSGDKTQNCGGDWRLNVFQVGSLTTTPVPSASSTSSSAVSTRTSAQYSAEGCYTEASQGRALISAQYADDAMTVEMCSEICAGYALFGVEYGRECYCGNSRQAGSVLALSSDCNMPCAGQKSETCGAGLRLNMYRFGSSTTSSASSSASSTTSSSSATTSFSTTSTLTTSSSTSTTSFSNSSTLSTSLGTSTTSSSSTSTLTAITSSTTSSTQSSTSTSTASAPPTPSGLVPDGGFESPDYAAAGWLSIRTCTTGNPSLCGATDLNAAGNRDTAPHGGLGMASISITRYDNNAIIDTGSTVDKWFPVTRGTTYTFSAWTWIPDNAINCNVDFIIFSLPVGQSSQTVRGPQNPAQPDRSRWVQTMASFAATTATSVRLRTVVSCYGGNQVLLGTTYIDDISFTPVTGT